MMEKSERKGPVGRSGVDQRIILKWILNRTGEYVRVVACEYGNESWCFIKDLLLNS
jgi:hypothetical protein